MEKILDNVKKEIKQIAKQGINYNNIDVLYKLIDIEKDIHEIKEKEGGSIMRRDYMDRDYGMPRTRGRDGRYMDRDSYNRDNYGHIGYDDRIYQYIDRIMEGANEYQYGKDRYRDGGTHVRCLHFH